MQDYIELEKLYYKNKDIKSEYESRINNPCSIKTSLFINPINNRGNRIEKEYELFYLPIKDILILQDKINENSKIIITLSDKLPSSAKESCIIEIMVNEIVKSNEVEGINTTKKEIYEVMSYKKADRLSGIVNKYTQIINKKFEKIIFVEDFRKLYDEIFGKDLLMDENNKLDGELFRNTKVHINNGLKNIHTGDSNEKIIIKHLKDLIKFMNDDSVNFLIKASITHYYFEYIHPFYDGNGRTGRFLCSMYLARKLDILTGLSLSYSIFNEKNKYSKLFKSASSEKNFGEMTFFIKGFLEFILRGQENIKEMLKSKRDKLDYIKKEIEKLELEKIKKMVLMIYSENFIFSDEIFLKDKDLSKRLKISRNELNKVLKELVEHGYLIKIRKNPSIHILGDKIKI